MYKLLLLLWREFLLVEVLGGSGALTALVSSRQRSSIHTKQISIILVYKIISWLARFDRCKRLLNQSDGG
jgi:hypothetical protein